MSLRLSPSSVRSWALFALFVGLCLQTSIANAVLSKPEELVGYNKLSPSDNHPSTAKTIVRRLEHQHYRVRRFDDSMSSEALDRFVNDLDRFRLYFYASDIKQFEKYRYQLDDLLRTGKLEPSFAMFNRYQERLIDRLRANIALLERGPKFDFTKDEYVEADREDSDYAKDKTELDDIWRKRIKNSLLSAKLNGRSVEEAKNTLLKRYTNQLNRAYQETNEDAFSYIMNSLTRTYDPHTQYFSPRISENFNINMSLQLEGIGAVLQSEDAYTKVLRLIPGGPAAKAGQLQPADRIVGVAQDDEPMVDVVGWRLDDVVGLIRGPKNSVVRLEVIPSSAESEHETDVIEITRNTVELEGRAAKKHIIELSDNNQKQRIGVIEIPSFYSDFSALQAGRADFRSTTRDVTRLIKELKREDIDGIIIDLRDNGGGSLQEVNTVVGLFIDRGPTVQIRNYNGAVDQLDDNTAGALYTGPLAVLVNRLSASASEIFAGAIQDYGRGLVLGSTTFGKGTVQSLQGLGHGQLKITLAKFYRVSGKSNQHQGIVPDIHFPSVFDPDEIGESALQNALPPDAILPAKYRPAARLGSVADQLMASHQARIAKNPDFVYIDEILEHNEANDKELLPLSEKSRIAEKDAAEKARLAIENRRRAAKGESLFKNSEELEKDQEEKNISRQRGDDKNYDEDFVLQESSNILVDYITHTSSAIASHAPRSKARGAHSN